LSADAVKVSLFVASWDVGLQAVTVAFSAGAQNKNREIVFKFRRVDRRQLDSETAAILDQD
jgi:hypothetical protein